MKPDIRQTELLGLMSIRNSIFEDKRGSFEKLYSSDQTSINLKGARLEQVNISTSHKRGTIRGLHFQREPFTDIKLVRCTRGSIWDVTVDIRMGSSTFLKWHAEVLSSRNRRGLLIPAGFAHGFQSLTNNVELIYCHFAPYRIDAEGGISPFDTNLRIPWPLEVTEISDRDYNLRPIDSSFAGLNP